MQSKKQFIVGIGRDPSLLLYQRPDLIVTINRVQLAADVPQIALNDLVAETAGERRVLKMYDTDLLAALMYDPQKHDQALIAHIPDDVGPFLLEFQRRVIDVIEATRNGQTVLLNPYHSVYDLAQAWQQRWNVDYTLVGPPPDLALEYAKKVMAWQLAKDLSVPVPEGQIVDSHEAAQPLLTKYGDLFVASHGDPLYPHNFRARSPEDLTRMQLGHPYLVTRWEAASERSPNSQVLIGADDVLYLGQSDQRIVDNVKYNGNTFPTTSSLSIQDKIQQYSLQLARGMQKAGYRGITGFDWIERGEEPLMVEINPRKQRSSGIFFALLEAMNKESLNNASVGGIVDCEVAAIEQQRYSLQLVSLNLPTQMHCAMELYSPDQASTVTGAVPNNLLCSETQLVQTWLEQHGQPCTALLNVPVVGTVVSASVPNLMRIVAIGNTAEKVEQQIEVAKHESIRIMRTT